MSIETNEVLVVGSERMTVTAVRDGGVYGARSELVDGGAAYSELFLGSEAEVEAVQAAAGHLDFGICWKPEQGISDKALGLSEPECWGGGPDAYGQEKWNDLCEAAVRRLARERVAALAKTPAETLQTLTDYARQTAADMGEDYAAGLRAMADEPGEVAANTGISEAEVVQFLRGHPDETSQS